MGGTLRRREARLQQGRQKLLLSRLLGRRSDADDARQREEMDRAAQALPGCAHRGLRRDELMDAGQIRRAEPAGAAPADRERHQPAAVPQSGDGSGRKGVLRALRRAQGEEQALGDRLSAVEEIPRRTVPVVPRRRIDLRQLCVCLEARRREVVVPASAASCNANPASAGFVFLGQAAGYFLKSFSRSSASRFSRAPSPDFRSASDFAPPGVPKSGGVWSRVSSLSEGTKLWTFDGSPLLFTRFPVTSPGKPMTMPTMMT